MLENQTEIQIERRVESRETQAAAQATTCQQTGKNHGHVTIYKLIEMG